MAEAEVTESDTRSSHNFYGYPVGRRRKAEGDLPVHLLKAREKFPTFRYPISKAISSIFKCVDVRCFLADSSLIESSKWR